MVAQQQVLGKTTARVADAQHHVLLFCAVELGAHHADEAERHAGMVGEHGFEVGAMDTTELHAREAFDGIMVDVVLEEHAVPKGLAVVQHIEDVFLAAGGGAVGFDAARAHDDDRFDGVALVHQNGAAFMRRVT